MGTIQFLPITTAAGGCCCLESGGRVDLQIVGSDLEALLEWLGTARSGLDNAGEVPCVRR
jgi:hypothetical protein